MSEYGEVLYMVWADVNLNVEEEWSKWVDESHVSDVVTKGGFLNARRFIVKDGTTAGKHATIYEAKDAEALRKYFDGAANALREDYNKRYGSRVRLLGWF